MPQHKEEPANQILQMHHQAAPQLPPSQAEFSTTPWQPVKPQQYFQNKSSYWKNFMYPLFPPTFTDQSAQIKLCFVKEKA